MKVSLKHIHLSKRSGNKNDLRIIVRLTECQKGMLGSSENQHPPEDVLVDNVVLDVVRVVLNAECQQLQYQGQQLGCLKII